jgi:hypothetical protein
MENQFPPVEQGQAEAQLLLLPATKYIPTILRGSC